MHIGVCCHTKFKVLKRWMNLHIECWDGWCRQVPISNSNKLTKPIHSSLRVIIDVWYLNKQMNVYSGFQFVHNSLNIFAWNVNLARHRTPKLCGTIVSFHCGCWNRAALLRVVKSPSKQITSKQRKYCQQNAEQKKVKERAREREKNCTNAPWTPAVLRRQTYAGKKIVILIGTIIKLGSHMQIKTYFTIFRSTCVISQCTRLF